MTRKKRSAAASKKKTNTRRKPTQRAAGNFRIGIDPLAWIGDDDAPGVDAESKSELDSVVVSGTFAEPANDEGEQGSAEEVAADVERDALDVAAGPVTIELTGRFTVAQVADTHQRLQQAFQASSAVEVDSSQLETIDGAALQLLIAGRRAATSQGLAWTWKGENAAFRDAARLGGALDELDI